MGSIILQFYILDIHAQSTTVHVDTTMCGVLALNCSYIGFPSPNVSWTLNGIPLNTAAYNDLNIESSMMDDVNTSMLTWLNVPDKAGGRYSCIIANTVGFTNVYFYVAIKCKI